jgi:hypothetical protein
MRKQRQAPALRGIVQSLLLVGAAGLGACAGDDADSPTLAAPSGAPSLARSTAELSLSPSTAMLDRPGSAVVVTVWSRATRLTALNSSPAVCQVGSMSTPRVITRHGQPTFQSTFTVTGMAPGRCMVTVVDGAVGGQNVAVSVLGTLGTAPLRLSGTLVPGLGMHLGLALGADPGCAGSCGSPILDEPISPRDAGRWLSADVSAAQAQALSNNLPDYLLAYTHANRVAIGEQAFTPRCGGADFAGCRVYRVGFRADQVSHDLATGRYSIVGVVEMRGLPVVE